MKALTDELRAFNETTIADAVALQVLMIRLKENSSEDLERLTARLVSFAPYSAELNNEKGTKTLKRITGKWIDSTTRDPTRPLLVALQYNIPEGAGVARRVLEVGPADEIVYNLAMQTILVYGDATDIPLVEKYFDNERIVFKEGHEANGVVYEITQLYRDLALAVAVHLRGYEMREYFPKAEPHHLRKYSPETLKFVGVDADIQRRLAFELYKESIAKQAKQ